MSIQAREKSILLIDRDEDFLVKCADSLRAKSMQATTTSNWDEASFLLQHAWYHLAVIDLSMDNQTGTRLAINCPKPLRKIFTASQDKTLDMWRDYPASWSTRYNIRQEYYIKSESLEKLWQLLDAELEDQEINWKLEINHKHGSIESLFYSINSNLPDTSKFSISEKQIYEYRQSELHDLLCKLFNDKDNIEIELRTPEWVDHERIGFQVKASRSKDEPMLSWVTIGPKDQADQEKEEYKNGITDKYLQHPISWKEYKETSHYGANLYVFSGHMTQNCFFLTSLATRKSVVRTSTDNGFDRRLKSLREDQFIPFRPDNYRSIDEPACDLFRKMVFPGEATTEELLKDRILHLSNWLGRFGHKITLDEDNLRICFVGQEPKDLTNPLCLNHPCVKPPLLVTASPGFLSLENLLSDKEYKIWLTNTYPSKDAPLSWIPANIEAIIRFDLTDDLDLTSKIKLEESLSSLECPPKNLSSEISGMNGKVDQQDPNEKDPINTTLQRILETRRWAKEVIQKDIYLYLLALYYLIARRLYEYDPRRSHSYNVSERNRFAHLLYSMGFIAKQLGKEVENQTGLWYDDHRKIFMYNEKGISFSEDNARLFDLLYRNVNQDVDHNRLIQELRSIKQNKQSESKQSKDDNFLDRQDKENLYTIINRIRKALAAASEISGDEWIWRSRTRSYSLKVPPHKDPSKSPKQKT